MVTHPPAPPHGPPYLQTLGNGLLVLDTLADHGPLSVRELANRLSMNRASTYRLVFTLSHHGYITRLPDDTYRVGARLWQLGSLAVDQSVIRANLSAQVQSLAREHGETVHVSVYDFPDVIYVDKADGSHPITSYSRLGSRAPAFCVATGKALLARQSPAELARIADQLTPYTPTTITSRAQLVEAMDEVRSQGYAINNGEWRPDVGGVAIVLDLPGASEQFGLGFSGPVERIIGQTAKFVRLLEGVRDSVLTEYQ